MVCRSMCVAVNKNKQFLSRFMINLWKLINFIAPNIQWSKCITILHISFISRTALNATVETCPHDCRRPNIDWCMYQVDLTTHFLVTDSITKRSNYIVVDITFATPAYNGSLIHTAIIIFCLATRQKQSIKINHLNNYKHVLQCADITSLNDFANESLKVLRSRAAHVRGDLIGAAVVCARAASVRLCACYAAVIIWKCCPDPALASGRARSIYICSDTLLSLLWRSNSTRAPYYCRK